MADTTTSATDLLGELTGLRTEIDEAQAHVADLFTRRVVIFDQLRQLDPPVTQRVIAEAAGIHEVGVIQALKRYREKS